MATTAARPDSQPTAVTADGVVQRIQLDQVQTDRNVRELADEDVAGLTV